MGAPTYVAERTETGWTILGVPVFSEHVDERGGRKVSFDRAWLAKALDRAKVRDGEGYAPPLHVRHHGDDEVVPAGRFRLRRLGRTIHGGRVVWTLFADLIDVPDAIYERIKAGELVYRSVEILDPSKAEIDSLALLNDEVPFFRYPLLRVEERTPVLAYRAAAEAGGVAVLLTYGQAAEEDDVADDKPDRDEQMLALLTKIAKKLGADQDEDDEGGEDEKKAKRSAEPEPDAVPGPAEPPAEAAAAGPAVELPAAVQARAEGARDAIAAQLSAMQREVAELRLERKIEQRAAALKARGVPEDVVRKFRAKASKDGEEVALAYADAAEELRPEDPPAGWTGELRRPAADPPEVAAYAQEGPQALAEARRYAAMHARGGSEVPLDEYLKISLDPDKYAAESFTAGVRRS